MSSKLKKINININSSNNINDEKKELYLLDKSRDLKFFLKPKFTIVFLNCSNHFLVKSINKKLKGECKIIVYVSKQEELAVIKSKLNRKNVIVLYSNFEINNLKSHIADLIICENILGQNGNNLLLIKEINRVLKQRGHFVFFESIVLDNPFYVIKSFYKKRIEPRIKIIVSNMMKKLKKVKNSEYDMDISGVSNFNYNSEDIDALDSFYIFLINLIKKNKKVLLNNFDVFIKGSRGY
jgi:hypothetical protein